MAPWRSPAGNKRGPSETRQPASGQRSDTNDARQTPTPANLRLGYVPGATPGKWAKVWENRHPRTRLELIQVHPAEICGELDNGNLDLALAREPVDRDRFHAIRLYDELPVVVFPREHHFAATNIDEEVTSDDIAEEVVFTSRDDVLCPVAGPEWPPGRPLAAYQSDGNLDPNGVAERPANVETAISWVAGGAGLTIVPMSLARLYNRKDVGYRVFAEGPKSPMSLIWPISNDSPLIQDFIGIVRGRTPNSSRGLSPLRRDCHEPTVASQT